MSHSIRDMASLLGVSKSQVQRDKAAGMPMTDTDAARAWRLANHDMSRTVEGRIDRPAAAASAPPPASPASPDAEDEPPAPGDTEEYRRYRTERERIRAQREQLDLDRDLGLVIDLREAQRLHFTAYRQVRDRLLYIPDRIPGLTDQQRATLTEEISAAIAVDPEQLLTDADEDDDDETS